MTTPNLDPTQIAIDIYDAIPGEVSDDLAWSTAVQAVKELTGEDVTYTTYEYALTAVAERRHGTAGAR